MILSIHRNMKFDKQMEFLRNSGGTAANAVKKAEEIIERIVSKGRTSPDEIGRLTKNGELRLKHGRKYDLGSGYRLICVHRGYHLMLLYIGSHDECSRWLEHNRGFDHSMNYKNNEITATREMSDGDQLSVKDNRPDDEYEKQLMKKIDDKTLRRIFFGICGE